MMNNNGSVSNNVKYQHICVESFAINVAYNYWYWLFEVENNSMVELAAKYGDLHGEFVGAYSYIIYDDEILSKFFFNHNIIVKNWIDSNNSWGWGKVVIFVFLFKLNRFID